MMITMTRKAGEEDEDERGRGRTRTKRRGYVLYQYSALSIVPYTYYVRTKYARTHARTTPAVVSTIGWDRTFYGLVRYTVYSTTVHRDLKKELIVNTESNLR